MNYYLIGAGGHAKVIIEILELNNHKVKALFDTNKEITSILDYPVIEWNAQLLTPEDKLIVSIGNNKIRKKVAERDVPCDSAGIAFHPNTNISTRVVIGEGTVIMAGVTVNSETIIGKHCIINTNASIDHECVLEDFVHISPNATLSGNVKIGEGTHIGAGAVIIQGTSIGKWCTIGAGAVIIRDVPDGATVVGNPGRIIKTS